MKIGIDSSRGWRRSVARPIAIVTGYVEGDDVAIEHR
jgi:hypothetical protein